MIDHVMMTVDDTEVVMIEVAMAETTTDTTTVVLPTETMIITMVAGECSSSIPIPLVLQDNSSFCFTLPGVVVPIENRKLTAHEVTGTLGIVSESPCEVNEVIGKPVLDETGTTSKSYL
jgi:hypothetical protein